MNKQQKSRISKVNVTELGKVDASNILYPFPPRWRVTSWCSSLCTEQLKAQSNSGRAELTLQQCPLCPGLTLYLPACSLIPCQDKPLCWVTVLVAKQSALVFDILQSACIGLAVSQDTLSHTHTFTHTDWGPAPYPISTNERRVWWCVLRATC